MRELRFYEKHPTVRQAVTLLFKFPPDIRTVLAKGFCTIAESDFDAHVLIKDFKRLGKEKVLALYKSTQRRRDYDSDPYLTKAMNYLMILTPHEQFFLSVKLLDLMHLVRDFMVLCKKQAISLQLAIIEKITCTYVDFGRKEAEDFLQHSKTMYERLFLKDETQKDATQDDTQKEEVAASNEANFWQSIANEGTGMRVRMNPDFL